MAHLDYNNGYYDGDVNYNGQEHGRGTFIWHDGEKYVGEWRNGEKHGHGVYYYSDGDKYDGEWRDDKRHGHGVFYFHDGDKYDGEWINDQKHGHGVYYFSNGDKYDGEFRNGDFNGHGVAYCYNGDKYDGQWRDGKFHGHGVHYSSGNKYDGEWRDGKQNGHGILYYNNGDKYDGEWRDGEKHGHGKYTGDGWYYEGEFRNENFNGYGTKRFSNGNYYVGYFSNDHFHGKGTWYQEYGTVSFEGNWIDNENAINVTKNDHGKKSYGKLVNDSFEADPLNGHAREDYDNGYYEGNFVNGKRHGRGTYVWNNGDRYDGEWRDGQKHGKGFQKCSNGSTYDGYWKNDDWYGTGKLIQYDGTEIEGCWNGSNDANDVVFYDHGTILKGKVVSGKFVESEESQKIRYANKGSTATNVPQNVIEELALKEVIENPFTSDARILTDVVMGDPRWKADDGWVKVERIIHITHFAGGKYDISIHYTANIRTKEVDDFKIKSVVKK